MIESIEVENLRGIKHGKLEGLTPLTVIVGPSGAGKSTVLDAAYVVGSRRPLKALVRVIERRELPRPMAWLFPHAIEGHTAVIAGRVEHRGKEYQRRYSISSEAADELTVKVDGGSYEITYDDDDVLAPNRSLANKDGQDSMLVDLSPDEGTPLHRVFQRALANGARDAVQALAARVVPGLERIELTTSPGDDTPLVGISSGRAVIPLALAGEGVRQLVRVALALGAETESTTFVIEEPETNQHPAAMRMTAMAIAAAITTTGHQVIASTHSLELVDMLVDALGDRIDLMTVFRVRLDNGVLRTSRFSGSMIRTARESLGEDLR